MERKKEKIQNQKVESTRLDYSLDIKNHGRIYGAFIHSTFSLKEIIVACAGYARFFASYAIVSKNGNKFFLPATWFKKTREKHFCNHQIHQI